MKRILMVLAERDFRDIEYIVPRAFFEQEGFTVETTSVTLESIGKHGYKVKIDHQLADIKADEFDGLFFVGGNGSLQYAKNETAKKLTIEFLDKGKSVAAICAAPQNLLHWGLGAGKEMTGWNGDGVFEKLALVSGAKPHPEVSAVADGMLVTGNGPAASEDTALEFIKLLKSH